MSSVTFQTTGNESRLLTTIFPAEYDVTALNWADVAKFPKFSDYKVGTNQIVHEAIKHCNQVVVKPSTFRRNLNKADKGTSESANWPIASTRKCIQLTDEEEERLTSVMSKYFDDDRTKTIIWMLYNYNRLVSMNRDILTNVKKTVSPVGEETKVFSLRLPLDVSAFADTQAIAHNCTPGAWLRDTLTARVREIIYGTSPEPTGDVLMGGFNYDLDGDDEL